CRRLLSRRRLDAGGRVLAPARHPDPARCRFPDRRRLHPGRDEPSPECRRGLRQGALAIRGGRPRRTPHRQGSRLPDRLMSSPATTPLRLPTLGAAARVWAKIGLLSFGGPAGQIALMHKELVEDRRWIGEQRFLHALNY